MPPAGVSPGTVDVGVVRPPLQRGKGGGLNFGQKFKRDWVMLALILPGLLFFTIFYYIELLGYVIAFENYLPFLGFFKSEFVGLANFSAMIQDASFWQAVQNTLIIAMMQVLLFFPAPILLALLVSSIVSTKWRRFIQSIVYLPHFIGWVIIVSLFQQLLGGTGVFNHFMAALGVQGVNVMASPPLFKWLVTFQLIWKDTGWGTIIYLAALLSIDASLYEAAAVDGAGRWKRMWNVTLPGILGITILLLILRLGAILSVGFEQILLQRDAVGPKAGEILDTWVYYHGIVGGQWGITAAAGLIKGIIGAAMVIGANKFAHMFGQEGLYN
ncbi:MAG TPA: ABC transporter permease subunit [Chloroflexota bacterium]|nr:ABC transporter permease subunit [Chloroflexota bacterium]